MKSVFLKMFLFPALCFCINSELQSQELTADQENKITEEIDQAFIKHMKAGESLDANGLSEGVNDDLKVGFIQNGVYFNDFETVINNFKERSGGVMSQKYTIINKKITILCENAAVLTASGSFIASLTDGRNINGNFAWTIVYSKIGNTWKVIHTHLSTPNN